MQMPVQTLDAYYQLHLLASYGWVFTQLFLVASLLLIGSTKFGRSAFLSISQKTKKWPLAAILFFFSTAVFLEIVKATIFHHVIVKKALLEASQAPSLLGYLGSQVPSIVATALLFSILGLILIYILKRRNSLTWLWLAIAVTAIVSGGLAARPFFRDAVPLGNSTVEQEIVGLLHRAGVPANRIAIEDCSSQSECPPGQVIGLGPTKLMLFDRRLASRTPKDRLLQVAAHEAKHFLIDNDLKPIIAVFLLCSFVFFVAQISIQLVRRSEGDQAARVQLALTTYAFGMIAFLLAQPIVTTWHRGLEVEADRFGLELNRNNQALIDIMWADTKQNPIAYKQTPITKYFRATHPQIKDRIHMAETYHPWVEGKPLRYGIYFSE